MKKPPRKPPQTIPETKSSKEIGNLKPGPQNNPTENLRDIVYKTKAQEAPDNEGKLKDMCKQEKQNSRDLYRNEKQNPRDTCKSEKQSSHHCDRRLSGHVKEKHAELRQRDSEPQNSDIELQHRSKVHQGHHREIHGRNGELKQSHHSQMKHYCSDTDLDSEDDEQGIHEDTYSVDDKLSLDDVESIQSDSVAEDHGEPIVKHEHYNEHPAENRRNHSYSSDSDLDDVEEGNKSNNAACTEGGLDDYLDYEIPISTCYTTEVCGLFYFREWSLLWGREWG